jgi:hypothetical protein
MKDNKKSVFNVGGKYTCVSSVKFDNASDTIKASEYLDLICPETIRITNNVVFNLLLLNGKHFMHNNIYYDLLELKDLKLLDQFV